MHLMIINTTFGFRTIFGGLSHLSSYAFGASVYMPDYHVYEVVSDRRWFRPNLSAEYSAETEYSARATETESQNSVFFNFFQKKIEKR
jgi:hypothetical protein